jgi:glycine hydroxymethyltransferase
MEHVRQKALEVKPKMIIAGASSYSRIIDWAAFRSIADEVGAYFLADIAHFAGLIAGKAYPSPLPHAHFVTFSTHKVIRGPRGGGIVSNHQEFKSVIDKSVFPGCQGGSLMHTIAAKAICFEEANSPEFREYSKNVVQNARSLAKYLSTKGWKVVSGGTDCHMFVLDLSGRLSGLEAENLLAQNGILVSRSLVPNDIKKSSEASGIRIGTASMTSRGFMDMELLAEIIDDLLTKKIDRRDEILRLCAAFPLPE